MQPDDPETPAPEAASPPPTQTAFRLPAEYYSTPVTARPLVASWVPFGCGGASLFLLALLFAGGAMVANGGISGLLDFTFATMEGEVGRMFAADVTSAQRSALLAEMKTMRANIRAEKADLRLLQPVITTLQESTSDKLVNAVETEKLLREIQTANAEAAKPKSQKKKP